MPWRLTLSISPPILRDQESVTVRKCDAGHGEIVHRSASHLDDTAHGEDPASDVLAMLEGQSETGREHIDFALVFACFFTRSAGQTRGRRADRDVSLLYARSQRWAERTRRVARYSSARGRAFQLVSLEISRASAGIGDDGLLRSLVGCRRDPRRHQRLQLPRSTSFPLLLHASLVPEQLPHAHFSSSSFGD